MSMSKLAFIGALANLASFVPQVAAHGYVSGIVVDGTYYNGYLVNQYPYENPPPAVIGWTETATDLGYVSDYTSPDIICHKSATNGKASATVAAGKDVTFEWTTWPSSHHGPVISYLASCGADCTTVDKTSLEFVKFDAAGLISDSANPGTWASDQLIANNNSWTVTIPATIKPGNYVLRHEIIALHSAGNQNGAQNYPQCINLEITGGGSDAPAGTAGEKLYTATDPGILVNIYQTLSSYAIPGPAIPAAFASGSSGSGSNPAPSSAVATSAAPVATSASTSAVASSASSVAVSSAASVAPTSIASVTPASSQALAVTPTTTAVAVTATAPALASSVASALSSLATGLPSSIATAPAPTATATTSSGQTVSTAGLTVSQLMDLLKQILLQLFNSSTNSTKARRHARDLMAA